MSRTVRFMLLACGLAACAAAWAREPALEGLLRGRDLTPFGFLRLDMRPAHSVTVEPGAWAVEVNLGYQNTWALSRGVQDYLLALPGRRRLGPAEFDAIRALPGENYLADFELGMLDIALHRKLDRHWSAYAILSVAAFGGGFLDGLIENFHDEFGFESYGRPAVQRNGTNFVFDLRGVSAQRQEMPRGGVLDPTFGMRYAVNERAEPWNVVLEGAVKVPVAGKRDFLSNGNLDAGAQATLQYVNDRHGVSVSLAAVHTRVSIAGEALARRLVPAVTAGYEFAVYPRTSLMIQGSAARAAFDGGTTDLDELRAPKYQYAIGVRHRFERSSLTLALTENVKNVNNTPDVGLQLGWVWWP